MDDIKRPKPKKTVKKVPKKKDTALADMTADLQRLQADFVNFRRRAEEERLQAVSIGKSSVILEILPVLDNMQRALAHQPADIAEHDWVKGVGGIAKQVSAKLESLGLNKVETLGQEFNPQTMEAVGAEGEGDQEIVSEELQAGYEMNGEVVRAAMVRVVRK